MSINGTEASRMNKFNVIFDAVLRIERVVHYGERVPRQSAFFAEFLPLDRLAALAHVGLGRDDPTRPRPIQRTLVVLKLFSE